ncbi:MAG: DMT family transporter [Puniceicoccales bacterium]|jgi:drug/metabolite transporter (DMT)-like permease|nr:DMT family transporter [Puniceicoccales bacterium]
MVYLLLAAMIWGSSYGINCHAMKFSTAPAMGLFFGIVAMAMFCPFAGHESIRRLRLKFAAVGAVQLGLMYFFYQNAMAHLESHQIALFGLTTPIFVGLFSDLFEHKTPWRHLVFASISVGACAFAVGGNLCCGTPLRGFMESQISNAFYGLGQVLFSRLKSKHGAVADRSALFWMNCGSLLPLAAAMLLIPAPTPPVQFSWTGEQVATLLFLGIIPGAIGNYLWNKGVGSASTGTLLICNNMPAIFGLFLGRLLLGESGSWLRQCLSLSVLLALLLLQNRRRGKKFYA